MVSRKGNTVRYITPPREPHFLRAQLFRNGTFTKTNYSVAAGDLNVSLAIWWRVDGAAAVPVPAAALASTAAPTATAAYPEQASRDALQRRWNPLDRALDQHIVGLRRKLGAQAVATVRGRGYQLTLPLAAPPHPRAER